MERIRLKHDLSIYDKCPVKCPRIEKPPCNISEYLELLDSLDQVLNVLPWFRGHADLSWNLTPSALRYKNTEDIGKALKLLIDFKRIADFRIERPPAFTEGLKWMQLAQHYGLPTRLMDWTTNAAVALYFACLQPDNDGLVFIMDPTNLNINLLDGERRLLDPNEDNDLIKPFIDMHERDKSPISDSSIAIEPVINDKRIQLQRGVFTLHGNSAFEISNRDAPSLCYIPILSEYKPQLFNQLCVIGIDAMSIFPEPEYLCSHLKRLAELS